MRIAKPVLLTTTPIGLAFGFIEAAKVGTWLLVLMLVLVGFVSLATWLTVRRIQRERQPGEPDR